MRPSTRLLHACRITLFTRPDCGLCSNAKAVLSKVWDKRAFTYREINVMDPAHRAWKDSYEFDVPVIHVQSSSAALDSAVDTTQKLMHRFTEADVHSRMNQVDCEPEAESQQPRP